MNVLTAKSYKLTAQQGFSLVEVLLASAVLSLLMTAFIGAILFGEEATQLAGSRARAVLFAEEGLEAVKNIRDNSFASLADGTYGLATSSNQWVFSVTSGTTDIFTRSILISTPATNRRQVLSRVTWQQNPERQGIVELVTYLTNWLASAGAPTSCSTFCQSLGTYNDGQCRADALACTLNLETHEAGGDPYCPSADPVDTCCCQP